MSPPPSPLLSPPDRLSPAASGSLQQLQGQRQGRFADHTPAPAQVLVVLLLQAGGGTLVTLPAQAILVARMPASLAVGETALLLHPPLPLVGVSTGMERGCQHNDRTLADGNNNNNNNNNNNFQQQQQLSTM